MSSSRVNTVLPAVLRWLLNLTRGMAFFLGVYAAFSLYAMLVGGSYNANAWWIDMSRVPRLLSWFFQLALIVALVGFTFRVPKNPLYRLAAALLFVFFAVLALQNALQVIRVASLGYVRLGFPVPFSVFIMLAFLLLAGFVFFGHSLIPTDSPSDSYLLRLLTILTIVAAVVLSGIAFPLGQVVCFGMTDYTTKVDAVVVFGARAYPSGALSGALSDRVDKGIELYHAGYTPILIMSGGTSSDGVNEAAAMRRYALDRGVPDEAIIVEPDGTNTEQSVANTLRIAVENGYQKIGAVSSFYHMPRIKMFFLSSGHDVVTIPATMSREGVGSSVRTTIREIPAWWYYWFKLALG